MINKLRRNPKYLEVLGDGEQRKSYLHVSDAIDATIRSFNYLQNCDRKVLIYNVSNKDSISVKEIVNIILEEMNLEDVECVFKPATNDGRGWLGDVKTMLLDIAKISREVGWEPKLSSKEAVRLTVKQILNYGVIT